jgi:hypothetical protein
MKLNNRELRFINGFEVGGIPRRINWGSKDRGTFADWDGDSIIIGGFKVEASWFACHFESHSCGGMSKKKQHSRKKLHSNLQSCMQVDLPQLWTPYLLKYIHIFSLVPINPLHPLYIIKNGLMVSTYFFPLFHSGPAEGFRTIKELKELSELETGH